MAPRFDLSKPRYDQSTYEGRARHFFDVCDPRTVLASDKELDNAKNIVQSYRAGADYPEEELWAAKKLYDSAFHPETGEKLFLLGRMSFQVPGNMIITAGMMTFLSTTPQVVFWQTINQTFNATVNYTNRNASSPVSNTELGMAYLAAVSTSVGVALGLRAVAARVPALQSAFAKRLVPLAAISAANCVNIPLMRSVELTQGITVVDEDGKDLGKSTAAAKSAIPQVVASRIMMAMPSSIVPNLLFSAFERRAPALSKNLLVTAPLMCGLVGLNLVVSTPLACAVFPQTASLPVEKAEKRFQGLTRANGAPVKSIFFNKGL